MDFPAIYACMLLPVVALAGGLLWFYIRARRARRVWRSVGRRAEMRCERCGYDIRASPDRCPECGHVTPWSAGDGGVAHADIARRTAE